MLDAMAFSASGKLKLLHFGQIVRRSKQEASHKKLVGFSSLDGLAMKLDYQIALPVALVAVHRCARLPARHLFVIVYEESFSAQVYILELGSLSEVHDS